LWWSAQPECVLVSANLNARAHERPRTLNGKSRPQAALKPFYHLFRDGAIPSVISQPHSRSETMGRKEVRNKRRDVNLGLFCRSNIRSTRRFLSLAHKLMKPFPQLEVDQMPQAITAVLDYYNRQRHHEAAQRHFRRRLLWPQGLHRRPANKLTDQDHGG
jgi:hypothetical protein